MTGHTGLQLHMYDLINASCRSSDSLKETCLHPCLTLKSFLYHDIQ